MVSPYDIYFTRFFQTVFASDRHKQALILKVAEFYRCERLYLLRCIQHIFSYWQDDTHPYQVLF